MYIYIYTYVYIDINRYRCIHIITNAAHAYVVRGVSGGHRHAPDRNMYTYVRIHPGVVRGVSGVESHAPDR